MKTKLYYSIQNGGDGSAGIAWMESLELAQLDQEFMAADGEGWGEPCWGFITIDSDKTVELVEEIHTVEDTIERVKVWIKDPWDEDHSKVLKTYLGKLEKLRDKQ